jgi:hypothetical protein
VNRLTKKRFPGWIASRSVSHHQHNGHQATAALASKGSRESHCILHGPVNFIEMKGFADEAVDRSRLHGSLYGGPHCLDQKNAFLSYTLDPSFGLFLRHSVSPR